MSSQNDPLESCHQDATNDDAQTGNDHKEPLTKSYSSRLEAMEASCFFLCRCYFAEFNCSAFQLIVREVEQDKHDRETVSSGTSPVEVRVVGQ